MKKTLSLIIVLTMMLSLVSMLGLSVSAANGLEKTYEAANDGDVIYNVLFNQTEGAYVPSLFAAWDADASNKGFAAEVSADGKTVAISKVSANGAADGRVYWGAPITGLTLGEGKQYTIEADITFNSNNAGVVFTHGASTAENIKDELNYSKMFGIYGKAKGCLLMGGDRIYGKYVCKAADTNWYHIEPAITTDSDIYKSTTKKVVFVVDGYDYYVFIDGYFFDMTTIPAYEGHDNLGFSLYLWGKDGKVTASNVVVKKGAALLKTTTFPTTVNTTWRGDSVNDPAYQLAKSYADAKDGEKLLDLKMNSTSGVFAPQWLAQPGASVEATENSVTITVTKDKTANYWGGTINGLKIAKDTVYTMQYKLKNSGAYTGMVASNCVPDGIIKPLNSTKMYGLYGNLNDKTQTLIAQLNGNGGAYNGLNYDTVAYPTKVDPLVDADGFTDVRVVLDGFKITTYVMDVSGEYKMVATTERAEIDVVRADCLGLAIYAYWNGRSVTVKDASVFKGDLFNPVKEETTVTPTPTPVPNPGTGDATSVIAALALVAACTLAGVSFGKKR